MTTCDLCTKPCPRYNEIKNLAEGRMFAMKELAALCKKIDNGTLVEVVRCRECKYGRKYNETQYQCDRLYGEWFEDDDFCSYGERKGGNE